MSENQIKEEIEKIGYKEFYRYYKEKDILLHQQKQELEQYKNNWEELKKWLEDEIVINKTNQIEDPNYPEWYIKWNCYLNLLNKMKELEEEK